MKRIFLFIVSWYSRRREFRADRGGANLAGSGSMIAALQVLKRSQGEPIAALQSQESR
jgi:heat shock protein HtpX